MKKIKFRNLLCWSPFCSWAALGLLGPRERETSCWVRERERVRVRLRSHQRRERERERERESKGRETNRREWSMARSRLLGLRERDPPVDRWALVCWVRETASWERETASWERETASWEGAGLLGERDSELGERDSELGERDSELRERDSELGAGRGTLRVRGRRSLGQRAPERRSVGAGRWAVVEWSVGTGPSFGEKELGAGRGTVRVRGGRSLGGGDGGGRG